MLNSERTHAVFHHICTEPLLVFTLRHTAPVKAHCNSHQRVCSLLGDIRHLVESQADRLKISNSSHLSRKHEPP